MLSTQNQLNNVNFKSDFGVVYTPSNLSKFVADKVVGYLLQDLRVSRKTIKDLRIIDPACGEGELLLSAWRALRSESPSSLKVRPEEVLCGIDIDEYAVEKTNENIKKLSSKSKYISETKILNTNALLPEHSTQKLSSWESIKKAFGAEEGFDILIANPPWGADMKRYERCLNESDYQLNKGQYDSSDLFVELSFSIVKDGGYFAFIIPDSLFSFERRELRKMLVENSEIKYVARLGEKIFSGINRACTVIVCKKKIPDMASRVTCMRLNHKLRKLILADELSFADADLELSHTVSQSRFSEGENYLFDIDTREEDKKIIEKITKEGKSIGDYVFSSRGVELSKTGKVYRCKKCDYWNPYPTTETPKCNHCGSITNLSTAEQANIISKKRFKGSKPLLVGESIRRYSISSQYWISIDNQGINYKNISIYYEPKIIVRKTGVGITASIDYSNSLTNQVVYMFRPRTDTGVKPVPVELVLAIMNSRAIYYYLLKAFGESEWRTHPYLTQKQILNLPVPNLYGSKSEAIGNVIVKKVKRYLEQGKEIPQKVDAEVERLIAKLFGLSKKDYELIYATLHNAENMLPVQALTKVAVKDIFR